SMDPFIRQRLEKIAMATSTQATVDSGRRQLMTAMAGAAVLPLFSRSASAQVASEPVSSRATERDWSGSNPSRYPDPDIIALDPGFRRCMQFTAPVQRLFTVALRAEGPAWNGVGRYRVWSDIPCNVLMRCIEGDIRVTSFRSPSGNCNGNTFDYQ